MDTKETIPEKDTTEPEDISVAVSKVLLNLTQSAIGTTRALTDAPASSVEFTNPFVNKGSNVDTPASKKDRFLPEELSAEQAADDHFRVFDKKSLKDAKREINEFGVDPKTAVLESVKTNRVVAFGESHVTPNPQRDFGADIMADLKKSGITHLAMEMPPDSKAAIKKFSETGVLDLDKIPERLRHDDFVKLLHSARDAHIELVVVDRQKPGLERELSKYSIGGSDDGKIQEIQRTLEQIGDRDTHMAKGVAAILKENRNNKVALWLGSDHLLDGAGRGTPKSAVKQLREDYGVKVATFLDVSPHDPKNTLTRLTTDLKQDVAVPINKTTALGQLTSSGTHPDYARDQYKNWDNVLIYAKKRKT
jgi:hypothetical protein